MASIVEIVQSTGMSARPEYYSGRGATLSDLNSKILHSIADAIKKNYGDVAEKAFVKMVWSMKKLSTTAFLQNLYALERANWDLSALSLSDNDYSGSENRELLSVLSALSGSKFDHTERIRESFRRH